MIEPTIDRLRHQAIVSPNVRTEVYPGDVIEELEAQLVQTRLAALEEAAKAECPYCASDIPLRQVIEHIRTGYYHYQNDEKWRIGCLASKIHALISVAGNHASQQPHATDAETTRG